MRADWALVAERKLYWDIKPTPDTELDMFDQWRNDFTSKQIQNYGKRIAINGETTCEWAEDFGHPCSSDDYPEMCGNCIESYADLINSMEEDGWRNE